MTVRAVTGEFAVVTLDGETGFFGVIEVRHVNGSEVCIAPLVLDVAHGAVLNSDLAMDSPFGSHSLGDQIVADETIFSDNIEVIVVAIFAAVWILEPLVREAEAAGHVIDLVFLCQRRYCAGDKNHRQGEKKKNTPKKLHPVLAGMRFAAPHEGHCHQRLSVYGIRGPPRCHGRAKIFGGHARDFLSSQCLPSLPIRIRLYRILHMNTCFIAQIGLIRNYKLFFGIRCDAYHASTISPTVTSAHSAEVNPFSSIPRPVHRSHGIDFEDLVFGVGAAVLIG